jgi:hypothetical protein
VFRLREHVERLPLRHEGDALRRHPSIEALERSVPTSRARTRSAPTPITA